MKFYDSATWPDLPHGQAVALYTDGRFAAPTSAPVQLGATHVRWITIANAYRDAGIIDWELGNPCFTAAALRSYVIGRKGMGVRARVYCDRADAHAAVTALGGLMQWDGLLFWIATLDGREWTAAELAAELARKWDAPIPAAKIWANQYDDQADKFDVSNLFGVW